MAGDILNLLRQDHQAAEALLHRFAETTTADRAEYFCEVVHTLVGHEVAEELVVYAEIRGASSHGEEIADQRIAEQAEAEETLAELEKMDPHSGAFTNKFKKLRDAVLAHAQAEESTTFLLLEAATTVKSRQELGNRYLKARDTAPTHPHPHSPDTPPGNLLLGPIVARFDRARDAIRHV